MKGSRSRRWRCSIALTTTRWKCSWSSPNAEFHFPSRAAYASSSRPTSKTSPLFSSSRSIPATKRHSNAWLVSSQASEEKPPRVSGSEPPTPSLEPPTFRPYVDSRFLQNPKKRGTNSSAHSATSLPKARHSNPRT